MSLRSGCLLYADEPEYPCDVLQRAVFALSSSLITARSCWKTYPVLASITAANSTSIYNHPGPACLSLSPLDCGPAPPGTPGERLSSALGPPQPHHSTAAGAQVDVPSMGVLARLWGDLPPPRPPPMAQRLAPGQGSCTPAWRPRRIIRDSRQPTVP